MTQLLTHPFRIRLDGSADTAEAGSDADIATGIAALVGTRIGERPMCWSFGVPDPAFAGLSAEDVTAGLGSFGPDGVRVLDVTTTPVDQERSDVVVRWART